MLPRAFTICCKAGFEATKPPYRRCLLYANDHVGVGSERDNLALLELVYLARSILAPQARAHWGPWRLTQDRGVFLCA